MRKITDHLGNEFPSVRTMCAFYRIPESVYHSRLKRGLSKRDALSMRYKRKIYKYNTHLFNDVEGLLAYAGAKCLDEIQDKVIII